MPIPTQRIKRIHIEKLKGLNNLTVEFGNKKLTAIMGVNGCGKTTVLHALACCYQPYTGHLSRNYIFSEFFTPNTDSKWNGSKFTLSYDHELASVRHRNDRQYKKDNDRWSPRYKTRLNRWVSYIGIKESVPIIEELNDKSFIRLIRTNRIDTISNRVRAAASYILNKNYTAVSNNQKGRKHFIGVQQNGLDYSISMGSGEQRVFRILEEVYKAPEYGLILIDEVELLMHTDALKRMIAKLKEIADEKHLQIIFTTHSEAMLDLKDLIDIRHIFIAENNNAFCLEDTNPKLLYELTGTQLRPISIFTEDELSSEIILKIAGQLGIRQHIKFDIFGPANNCFTTAAGAVLNGIDTDNTKFILDGDVYKDRAAKKTRINSVLSGTDFSSRRKKIKALEAIEQFNLPDSYSPEKFLHLKITETDPTGLDYEQIEIRDAALHIQGVDDNHRYIDDLILRLGYRENDYRAVVSFLSNLPFWEDYVRPIKEWLSLKKIEHNL